MPLTCQWQMSEAKERRRLFEDETGRNFGHHAGETSLSFESFAERRRRERFLEPQQYPAGDVYAAGGAERQRKVAGHRPQECAKMGERPHTLEISPVDGVTSYVGRRQRPRGGAVDCAECFIEIDETCATEHALGRDMAPTLPKDLDDGVSSSLEMSPSPPSNRSAKR